MTTPHRFVVAITLAVSAALPAAAQDLPIPIRIAVGCGPQATTASGRRTMWRTPAMLRTAASSTDCSVPPNTGDWRIAA